MARNLLSVTWTIGAGSIDWAALRCAVVLVLLSGINVYADAIELIDFALVNHPSVDSLEGHAGADALCISAVLRFVNQAALKAGAEAFVFDLPTNDPRATNCVLFFRQRPDPHGVPDIFRPAEGRFALNLLPLSGSSRLIVFNGADRDRDEFGARVTLTSNVDDLAQPHSAEGTKQLAVVDGLAGFVVPRLEWQRVELASNRRSRTANVAVKIAGDKNKFSANRGYLFRQSPIDGNTPDTVYLLILAIETQANQAAIEPSTTVSKEIRFELPTRRLIRLVVMNPIEGHTTDDETFFSEDLHVE